MGKLGKAVLGAVVIGAVTLLSGGTLTAVAISFGLALVSSTILAPKVPKAEARQASEMTLQFGETARQVLFGKGPTAGSMLDAFNYGGKYNTDWEVLLIALADHECDALEGFYVNEDYKAFGGNGEVAGYSGQLKVFFLPGNATQQWPSLVTSNGPGWTNTSNCKGVSVAVVAYKADDPESDKPIWTAGRPRFVFVLRGKKVYQVRKDSTVPGGNGLHRYANPATWEWTDNAAECRYQFQRGIYALDRIDQPDQLLLGRGLTPREAPPERSIVNANICDELVANATGTQRRYTFNGLIGADEDFLTAESYFSETMGGIIRQPEGGIDVEPGQGKAVAVEITDLDILNLAEVKVEHFRGTADEAWINTVTARYVEPTQKWSMHSAPIRRENADLVVDKGPRVASPEFKHVTNLNQCERLAEIKRRMGRLTATASLTLGPRFAELEEGDWIGWTSERHFKGGRRVFRIDSYNRDVKWHYGLQLRQIAANAYSFGTGDALFDQAVAAQQSPPPDIAAPSPTAWVVTSGEVAGLNGSQPAIVVQGAIDDNRANAVRFDYRRAGAAGWTDAGQRARNTTKVVIGGVEDGRSYEISVTNVVDGQPGLRRILPAIIVGKVSSAYVDLQGLPTKIADINQAEGDKVASVQSGATAGADWNSDVRGVPANLGAVTVNDNILNRDVTLGRFGNAFRLTGGAPASEDIVLAGLGYTGALDADKAGGRGLAFVDATADERLREIPRGATVGDNLLFNGGAEEGDANGWAIIEGGGGTLSVNSGNVIGGRYNFALDKPDTGTAFGVGARAVEVTPGRKYLFGVWLRGSGATAGGLFLRMSYRDTPPPGDYINAGNRSGMTDFVASGPYPLEYQRYQFVWTAPANAKWVSVGVYNWLGGPTGAVFDEASLQPLLYDKIDPITGRGDGRFLAPNLNYGVRSLIRRPTVIFATNGPNHDITVTGGGLDAPWGTSYAFPNATFVNVPAGTQHYLVRNIINPESSGESYTLTTNASLINGTTKVFVMPITTPAASSTTPPSGGGGTTVGGGGGGGGGSGNPTYNIP